MSNKREEIRIPAKNWNRWVMNSKYIFALASIIYFTFPLFASAQEGEKCAVINEDSKRLLCYDLLFKISQISNAQVSGKWNVTINKSKIDDSSTVSMVSVSTNEIVNKFGTAKTVFLAIVCKENTTFLTVSFDTFMSSLNGGGLVTYRIDAQKAGQIRMKESNNNTALGLWSGTKSIPFIRKLFGKSTLLIRATPFNESTITPIFNIAGIENQIVPLAKACNWKL